MIQELLCGALLMEEKKTQAPNLLLMEVSPSPSPAPSPPPPPPPAAAAGNEPQQNLRCPRCDSTNTKFCYYNNYNLTQPRHFCKTCRRYWTKGGALRNVPIGGGCRKAKPVPPSLSPASKSAACAKLRALPDPGAGRLTLPALGAFEPVSMSLWPPAAQTSGLMSLLRPPLAVPENPNPSARSLAPLDHLGQLAGDPYGAPIWKGTADQFLPFQQQPQPGVVLGTLPGSGLQELYQKLRASCQSAENAQSAFGSAAATGIAGSLLDPIPVAGGGDPMGFWSSLPLAWSDMSAAANGAFP